MKLQNFNKLKLKQFEIIPCGPNSFYVHPGEIYIFRPDTSDNYELNNIFKVTAEQEINDLEEGPSPENDTVRFPPYIIEGEDEEVSTNRLPLIPFDHPILPFSKIESETETTIIYLDILTDTPVLEDPYRVIIRTGEELPEDGIQEADGKQHYYFKIGEYNGEEITQTEYGPIYYKLFDYSYNNITDGIREGQQEVMYSPENGDYGLPVGINEQAFDSLSVNIDIIGPISIADYNTTKYKVLKDVTISNVEWLPNKIHTLSNLTLTFEEALLQIKKKDDGVIVDFHAKEEKEIKLNLENIN